MHWKETRSGKWEDYEDTLLRMTKVRQFANCVVFAAISTREEPVLLIVEPWRGTEIVCYYDDYTEREQDIEYLRSLPPGGPADAGVPARPLIPPPSRQAGNTKPFPPHSGD